MLKKKLNLALVFAIVISISAAVSLSGCAGDADKKPEATADSASMKTSDSAPVSADEDTAKGMEDADPRNIKNPTTAKDSTAH